MPFVPQLAPLQQSLACSQPLAPMGRHSTSRSPQTPSVQLPVQRCRAYAFDGHAALLAAQDSVGVRRTDVVAALVRRRAHLTVSRTGAFRARAVHARTPAAFTVVAAIGTFEFTEQAAFDPEEGFVAIQTTSEIALRPQLCWRLAAEPLSWVYAASFTLESFLS